jgi:hypothetical protein
MEQSLRAIELVSFVNLDSLEEKRVQFNPTELTHGISAEYTLFDVVGMGHQPHQYSHTTNREFSMTLLFKVESPADLAAVRDTENFLMSLMYAVEPGAAPPDTLLVWPSMTSTRVKVRGLGHKHTQFNAALAATMTSVDITLMAIHDRPRLHADVRENGIRG